LKQAGLLSAIVGQRHEAGYGCLTLARKIAAITLALGKKEEVQASPLIERENSPAASQFSSGNDAPINLQVALSASGIGGRGTPGISYA